MTDITDIEIGITILINMIEIMTDIEIVIVREVEIGVERENTRREILRRDMANGDQEVDQEKKVKTNLGAVKI